MDFFSFNSKAFECFLLQKQALEDIAEKQSRHQVTCDLEIKQHKSLTVNRNEKAASIKQTVGNRGSGRGVTTLETNTDITSLVDKWAEYEIFFLWMF